MTPPGYPPYGGICEARREIRRAAVLLRVISRIVVAKAEIDGEFTGHFPAILGVARPLLFAKAHFGGWIHLCRIHSAHQETGVRQPDVVATDVGGAGAGRSAHKVRHRRLRAAETVCALKVADSEGVTTLELGAAPEFKGVVALHPGQICNSVENTVFVIGASRRARDAGSAGRNVRKTGVKAGHYVAGCWKAALHSYPTARRHRNSASPTGAAQDSPDRNLLHR